MRAAQKKILIIDDEPSFIRKMRLGFKEYIFSESLNGKQSQQFLKKNDFDLILLDLNLDSSSIDLDGLNLIEPIKESHPDTPLVVVTADEKTETVVTAMKHGADDFLRKSGFDLLAWKKKFDLLIENKILVFENKQLKNQEAQKYPFIGNSREVQEIKNTLHILAEKPDVTLLITGETGVGKEVAARYLHQRSKRKDKPFVHVNLSSIQPTLLESALFGHKKGAYTGANYDREGYFRKANGGILFLDEIGDIDTNIQVKVLNFLDTKTIQVVGDEKDIQLDVQIIVATNRNLSEFVEENRFRSDLYYRIKNFQIEIPPLHHRKKDIPEIIVYYLKQAGYEEMNKIIQTEAKNRLIEYKWPGNIRELKNAVDSILLKMRIKEKSKIDIECLPDDVRYIKDKSDTRKKYETGEEVPGADIKSRLAETELLAIENALKKTYGQKQAAAEILGMSADQLRYRVLKWWNMNKAVIANYSHIKKYYKK